MKQTIILLLAIFCVFSLQAVTKIVKKSPIYVTENTQIIVDGKTYTLNAGTPLIVEAVNTTSSNHLSVGQSVTIRAKFNIVVDKETLVSAGALGTAVVSKVQKRKIFGKPGYLELQAQSIRAVDNQQVLLSGMPLHIEGKSKATLAWILSGALFLTTIIGGAVGFFIKGQDAEFSTGTQVNTSVASDMEIEPKQ